MQATKITYFFLLLFFANIARCVEPNQLELKDGKKIEFIGCSKVGEKALRVITKDGRTLTVPRGKLSDAEVVRRFGTLVPHFYGKAYRVKSKLPNDFSIKAFKDKLAPLTRLLKREEFKTDSQKLIKLDGKKKISVVAVAFVCASAPVIPYYVYEPKKYYVKGKKVPLVIFLHGVGEVGDNVKKLFFHPQSLIFISPENQKRYPCYFMAPQLPGDGVRSWVNINSWGIVSVELMPVIGIVKEMLAKYPDIDPDRIYVTGLSSGGFGAWELICKYPDIFAGAVPVAAGLKETLPMVTKSVKGRSVWVFNNPNENPRIRNGAKKMVVKFGKCGGEGRYTEYIKYKIDKKGKKKRVNPRGHFSWLWAYAEPDLIPWLFGVKKGREKKQCKQ